MKNKIVLLTGTAIGYVLGTRAGREQYEKIRSQAQSLWKDPRVQEKVEQAQQAVKEQVPLVQDKLGEKAKQATGGSEGSGSGSGSGSPAAGEADATGLGQPDPLLGQPDPLLGQPDPLRREGGGSGI